MVSSRTMTQMTITLSDEATKKWEERARLQGQSDAAEALEVWAEDQARPADPAEVEILKERAATDPADDIPYREALLRIADKHGVTLQVPEMEEVAL